ncbi:MAG: hypothetical protein MR429_00475 [Bifidobacterium animalis]|nr:hypothetical protein [Bifidobacterium animalis]
MARNGNDFARRLLRKEQETMKAKEHAAKRMYNALTSLRQAAGELQESVDEYTKLERMTRAQLGELLEMTTTEVRIAFDLKRELVAAVEPDDADDASDTAVGAHAAAPEEKAPASDANEPDVTDDAGDGDGTDGSGVYPVGPHWQ